MKLDILDGKFLWAGLFGAGLLMGCINSNEASNTAADEAALRSKGVVDDSTQWDKGGVGKQTVCHIPPGNPANAHTISVGSPAVQAHLAHGDRLGGCIEPTVPPKCDGKGHISGHDHGSDSTGTSTGTDTTANLPS